MSVKGVVLESLRNALMEKLRSGLVDLVATSAAAKKPPRKVGYGGSPYPGQAYRGGDAALPPETITEMQDEQLGKSLPQEVLEHIRAAMNSGIRQKAGELTGGNLGRAVRGAGAKLGRHAWRGFMDMMDKAGRAVNWAGRQAADAGLHTLDPSQDATNPMLLGQQFAEQQGYRPMSMDFFRDLLNPQKHEEAVARRQVAAGEDPVERVLNPPAPAKQRLSDVYNEFGLDIVLGGMVRAPAFFAEWARTAGRAAQSDAFKRIAAAAKQAAFGEGTLASQAGRVLNPAKPVLDGIRKFGQGYVRFRNAARNAWGRGFDAAEAALWTRMPEDWKAWLTRMLGTPTARWGPEIAAAKAEVAAAYPLAMIDAVRHAKTVENLSEAERRAMMRYVQPRIMGVQEVRAADLSQEAKAFADWLIDTNRAEGRELVELGLNRPDVIEAFNGHWYPLVYANKAYVQGNTHVKEAYRIKNVVPRLSDSWGAIIDAQPGEINHLLGGAGAGTPFGRIDLAAPAEALERGTRSLVKFKDAATRDEFLQRYRQAYGDKAKVRKKWDAWDEETRALYGEIVDPALNAYQAKSITRARIANGRFLEAISRNKAFAMSPEDFVAAVGNADPKLKAALEKWTQLPSLESANTASERLAAWRCGALKGMYVSPDVLGEIKRSTGLKQTWRFWSSFLSEWKASKTVWSVKTQFRNVVGNYAFCAMADNLAPWFGGFWNSKYYLQAIGELRGKKGEFFEEMLRKGVVGTQYSDVELGMLEDTLQALRRSPDEGGSALAKGLAAVARQAIPLPGTGFYTKSALAKPLMKAYNWGDAVYRAATFIKARKKFGMSADEAVAHVDRFFPNYQNVGEGIRMLSQSPFGGPFSRFGAEALRTFRNGMRYRPVKTVATLAFPAMMYGIADATLGLTDEEKQVLDNRKGMQLPLPWRGVTPFKDKDDYIHSIAMDYVHPLGSIANAVGGLPRAIAGLGDGELGRTFAELSGPFLFSNPAATGAAGLLLGVDPYLTRRTGRPIQIKNTMKWLLEQNTSPYTPFVGREAEKIRKLIQREPLWSGGPQPDATTVLDVLTGLRPSPLKDADKDKEAEDAPDSPRRKPRKPRRKPPRKMPR